MIARHLAVGFDLSPSPPPLAPPAIPHVSQICVYTVGFDLSLSPPPCSPSSPPRVTNIFSLTVSFVPSIGCPEEESTSSSSSSNVTLVEITQFQLNMWTGVGLALLGFLAIYATFTMDVQPDSLLYAKFITDTSGGGLKTD